MELPAFHVQGDAVQHGRLQNARRVRILEGAPGGRRRGEPRRDGHLGRITTVADLPSKQALASYIRKAAALNDQGVKVARPQAVFAGFAPSRRRDYLEWITEAKTGQTRARRLTQAIEWMADGKSRNWKYEKRSG